MRNKIRGWKKNFVAGLLMLSLVALVGCGGKTQEESEVPKESNRVADVEQEASDNKGDEQPERDVKNEEPEAEAGAMEKRLTELGMAGICVVVWNDAAGTEHIIENGEGYEIVDGDRFFICTPSFMTEIKSSTARGTKLGKPSDNYREITFEEYEGENSVEFSITCQNGEQGEISFFIENTVNEEQGERAEEEKGLDWVTSLGYDKPKMVVYNDTTGLRKELEEGEEYQLVKGDIVAAYTPDVWAFKEINIAGASVLDGMNIAVFEWQKLTFSDKLDVELSLYNMATEEIVTLHFTLLPPVE